MKSFQRISFSLGRLEFRKAILVLLFSVGIAACGSGSKGKPSSGPGAPGDSGSNSTNPYAPVSPNGQLSGPRNFASLISRFSQGTVKQTPWAGYWWPYAQEGISDAASKYEKARGSKGALSWELSHHGSHVPGIQDWWGHCNGWAAAAMLFKEPKSPVTVNGVEFTVADQKALMTEVAMEVNADFYGRREEDPNDFTSSVFEDVYPDQFFLVMTHFVGQGMPVLMDRYTGFQVWNQPIVGYKMDPIKADDYLGPDPSTPSTYRVMVTTRVWWAKDNVPGGHISEAFALADGPSYESRTLRYEVWMDEPLQFAPSGQITHSGNVILSQQGTAVLGGKWRNGDLEPANSHPDYLWIPHAITASSGFSNPNIDLNWVKANFDR